MIPRNFFANANCCNVIYFSIRQSDTFLHVDFIPSRSFDMSTSVKPQKIGLQPPISMNLHVHVKYFLNLFHNIPMKFTKSGKIPTYNTKDRPENGE